MRGAYLLALLVSLAGLGVIDWRYKLAFYKDRGRTLIILAVAVLIFCVWDIAGILLNIFSIGTTNVLLGVHIGQFPLEELFFLLLLNYTSLVMYLFIKRKAGVK